MTHEKFKLQSRLGRRWGEEEREVEGRGGERGVCLAAQKRWKRRKLEASVCYGNIFYEYFTENYFIGFSMSHLGIDMPCSVMSDATLLSW